MLVLRIRIPCDKVMVITFDITEADSLIIIKSHAQSLSGRIPFSLIGSVIIAYLDSYRITLDLPLSINCNIVHRHFAVFEIILFCAGCIRIPSDEIVLISCRSYLSIVTCHAESERHFCCADLTESINAFYRFSVFINIYSILIVKSVSDTVIIESESCSLAVLCTRRRPIWFSARSCISFDLNKVQIIFYPVEVTGNSFTHLSILLAIKCSGISCTRQRFLIEIEVPCLIISSAKIEICIFSRNSF